MSWVEMRPNSELTLCLSFSQTRRNIQASSLTSLRYAVERCKGANALLTSSFHLLLLLLKAQRRSPSPSRWYPPYAATPAGHWRRQHASSMRREAELAFRLQWMLACKDDSARDGAAWLTTTASALTWKYGPFSYTHKYSISILFANFLFNFGSS